MTPDQLSTFDAVTVPERTPMPVPRDLIDKTNGSMFFSHLDVKWSFLQVKLSKESIELTAFCTPWGQFEFLFLPFGLRNGSSVFQRALRDIIEPIGQKGVLQFVDDLIIATKTIHEHIELLEELFQLLADNGVILNLNKCTLLMTQIEFLGHEVGFQFLRPTEAKTIAITQFPRPTSVTSVRQFIGLSGFYRQFIKDFSQIARPLTDLTRNDVPFEWTESTEEAFQHLKQLLSTRPILHTFDSSLAITVTTDASLVGMGCVVTQTGGDPPIRTIAFWSAKFTEAESRYSSVERECLSVLRSLEHFRHWLDGATFTVCTDCSALTWLFKIDHANTRLHRWTIRLSAFDFTPKHISGKTNRVADALSRNPISICLISSEFLHHEELLRLQSEVETLRLRKPIEKDGLIHIRLHDRLIPVVPPSLVQKLLDQIHRRYNHCGARKMTQLIATKFWFPSRDSYIRQFVKTCHPCQITKAPNQSTLRPTHPIITPDRPMDTWACDFIVVGSAAASTAAKNILVVVDLHSRHVWVKALKAQTKKV